MKTIYYMVYYNQPSFGRMTITKKAKFKNVMEAIKQKELWESKISLDSDSYITIEVEYD